jgi:hypothetical protein
MVCRYWHVPASQYWPSSLPQWLLPLGKIGVLKFHMSVSDLLLA